MAKLTLSGARLSTPCAAVALTDRKMSGIVSLLRFVYRFKLNAVVIG
jgi:hypothetical protein